MSKLIPSIRQSFLALYTFLDSAYIILIALPYITATVYCYSVPVIGLFIFTILTPYLGATYTILNFNKFYLGTVLKI